MNQLDYDIPGTGRAPAGAFDPVVDDLALRQADRRDIGPINALIAAAMETWGLRERVMRLSLPLYQYGATDLDHLDIVVAEARDAGIVGVATVESADASESPPAGTAALLHGIYVDPARHGGGIGSRLLQAAKTRAAAGGYDGLLVRANPAATGFFDVQGFARLPVENPDVDYPYRYFTALRAGNAAVEQC